MNLFNELKERGLIYQVSNEEEARKIFGQKGSSFYIGFDATGPSLHIGNLLAIIFAKRLENAGLKPIILIGGATGMIGDPSGKIQERILNTEQDVKKFAASIKKQLLNFFSAKNAKILNNYDWIKNLSVINFLRDIGKNFSVNEMLAKESVAARLKTGISFTEFSYMVLQAYDFLALFKKYGCKLQIGGSDQWGNITAGIELIRKSAGGEALGLTIPLITKNNGAKFGKTEEGAIWLDSKLTSPYHFYQFWLNTDDKDAIKFLKYFTFLAFEEIEKLKQALENNPEKREAQKILGKEITIFVHGENAFKRAEKISNLLFCGKIKELSESELKEAFGGLMGEKMEKFEEINIADFLVLSKASESKRQAREDITNGAIELNGNEIKDLNYSMAKKDALFGKYIVIKRGKREYFAIEIK
jgi:tyrosyl-tRNA synthetase